MNWIARIWSAYLADRDAIVPLLVPVASLMGTTATLSVGVAIGWAAIKQAKIATSMAETARRRHEEQTDSDRQRRLAENFLKAVEQLGSESLHVRLGGIYALEYIARQSREHYWAVFEMLTAFVRTRASWQKPVSCEHPNAPDAPGKSHKMAQDILAILTVIGRRTSSDRSFEKQHKLSLDLSSCDLRGADFHRFQLENVDFSGGNLEGSTFEHASLEFSRFMGGRLAGVDFGDARLTAASFAGACLRDAYFNGASLQFAVLVGANLEEACFYRADLSHALFSEGVLVRGADFREATVDGVWLDQVEHLDSSQLQQARGDADTILPGGIVRPTHWAAVNLAKLRPSPCL